MTIQVSVYIRIISLTCVPLFIVISGYLLVNKVGDIKYYKKLVSIYFIYILSTILVTIVDDCATFNVFDFIAHIFNNILSYKYYGWYVNMYFGLFLLAPMLNNYYKSLTSYNAKTIYIVLFILLISIPVTLDDVAKGLGKNKIIFHIFPNWWKMIWPLMYYNIGLYLRELNIQIKKRQLIVAFLLISILAELFYIFFGISGESLTHVNIFIVSLTVLFFILIKNLQWNPHQNIRYMIGYISDSTLQAYLLSKIVDIIVYPYLLEFYPSYYERFRTIYFIVPMNIILVILLTIVFNLFVKLIRKILPLPDYFFR